MNKNKNTVSLDSKAGDVLTPAEVGGRVEGGGWGWGLGNRDPGNLAILEHGSSFRFLRRWTSSSCTTMKNPQNLNILDQTTPSPTSTPPPAAGKSEGGHTGLLV